MYNTATLNRREIISRLTDAIEYIDHMPDMDRQGLRDLLVGTIIAPDGLQPRFEGERPEVYGVLVMYCERMDDRMHQARASEELRALRSKYW